MALHLSTTRKNVKFVFVLILICQPAAHRHSTLSLSPTKSKDLLSLSRHVGSSYGGLVSEEPGVGTPTLRLSPRDLSLILI